MEQITYGAGEGAAIEAIVTITGCSEDRARALVKSATKPGDLRAYTPAEIGRYLTPSQARRLAAALSLPAVLSQAEVWRRTIRTPSSAADYLRAEIGTRAQECFAVVGLDSRQRVAGVWISAVGSLSQVDVHPREVFRPMVRAGVHSCILSHNHPSGDASPSEADIELTNRMSEVGRLVGIPVLDHLIVTELEHCSLAALGLLPAAA